MTKEGFIERMTGVKPEDQPIVGRIEELIDSMNRIGDGLDNICECIRENTKMTNELGMEVYQLRADFSKYVEILKRKG